MQRIIFNFEESGGIIKFIGLSNGLDLRSLTRNTEHLRKYVLKFLVTLIFIGIENVIWVGENNINGNSHVHLKICIIVNFHISWW